MRYGTFGAVPASVVDVMSGVPIKDEYIFAKVSDNQYMLCQGEVVQSGNILRVNDGACTLYDLRGYEYNHGNNYYSYYPTFKVFKDTMVVDTSVCMTYSSVAGFPHLSQADVQNTSMRAIGLLLASVLTFLIVYDIVRKAVLRIGKK